ncbi:MAG: WecB/TagA/CpsF family glycosyltransferase [Melioribacteraceae bacterium]|nr:WecB/TagA/CpsF family glycosyltransferase [Melioribacteraceae bacterium]MCF8266187.1 WecB/TagA/CpsF family glycosyltransferase [Melioribacteraceae bacterium]MCF8412579.1 WecB/TagA/CpsF family glycosyltransferase [Melioribacteraceae bacterium]MCF8431172.1 WecB/TagA/CpsF family glycosyltransferase [Melioribacteraceae bacterium]
MKIQFFDTFINIKDSDEYFTAILRSLQSDERTKVFHYLNSHSFHTINTEPGFKDTFNSADYIIADGKSVVWAVKLLTGKNIKKVVFTYFFEEFLARYIEKQQIRVYFLGTTEENLQTAVANVRKQYPKIQIVGWNNGYFDRSKSFEIIADINNSRANILIVGMGIPTSEFWINENRDRLMVKCIFSVGGFFEFIAGNAKLAPKWIYESGVEWVFRIIQEPRRLWRRYLNANYYFISTILKKIIKNGSR